MEQQNNQSQKECHFQKTIGTPTQCDASVAARCSMPPWFSERVIGQPHTSRTTTHLPVRSPFYSAELVWVWGMVTFPVLEYTRRTPRSRTTRRGKHPEEEHTRTPQWTVFDTCTYMYLPVHLWYTMLQSMAPLQIAKHIAKDRTRKQWSIRACRLLPVLEANGVTEYWVCPYHLIRHKKQNCKFYKLTFLSYLLFLKLYYSCTWTPGYRVLIIVFCFFPVSVLV